VIGEAGAPPHMTFTMAIEIDGKLYKGEGRNKKDAKRNCAVAALQEIYNIVYPKDGMDTSA
jgi:dsRNA-specific ribonuclease